MVMARPVRYPHSARQDRCGRARARTLMPVSPTPSTEPAEVVAFRDAAQFEAWLEANVVRQAGVWLKLAKQGSGIASLTAD